MKIISVIPARGNSKSIPLKNLAKLNKKPLIYYSIKQSLKCKQIDRTIVSTDNKGLVVRPENCEMDFQIKKSQIAVNAADARPSRFTGGERIDCAISELDLNKRKVILSIKLLEENQKKEALKKYGSEGSGKNLPFSSLSEDLKKKDEENNN